MPTAPGRNFVGGNFGLVLDGVESGLLKSADGGVAVADVIAEAAGTLYYPKKHIGPISYSPFVLEIGLGMANSLYDWIGGSWRGKAIAKSGAIVLADHNFVAASQREFTNALITETTFPALDATSKDPAYLTVTLSPESARVVKGSGKISAARAQKLWLPSNFRLAIDGLDCTRVIKVDEFTVKQAVVTDNLGVGPIRLRQAGRLEFPNLKITLAEGSATSWFDWFGAFVIKGDNDDSKEKNGSISLLGADLKEELMRIDLFNLGIFRIGQDRIEANSDRVATVSAHLYCERMELVLGAPAKPAVRSARTARRRAPARKVR